MINNKKNKSIKYGIILLISILISVLLSVLIIPKKENKNEIKLTNNNMIPLTLIGNGYFGNINVDWATTDAGYFSFSILNLPNEYRSNLSDLSKNKGTYFSARAPIYTLPIYQVPYKFLLWSDNSILVADLGKTIDTITFSTTDIIFLKNGIPTLNIPNTQYDYLSLEVRLLGTAVDDYNAGYENGLNDGKTIGFNEGKQEGLSEGWDNGYSYGYGKGKDEGFELGLKEAGNDNIMGFTALLTTVFNGIGTFLAIELIPNISIGALVLIPIVFGLILFVLGKRGD